MFVWPDSYPGVFLIPVFLLFPLGVFRLDVGVVQLTLIIFAALRLTRRLRRKPNKTAGDRARLAVRVLTIYAGSTAITNLLLLVGLEVLRG